ncbi:MAG: rane endopeptidase [Symbiobacteriaceae bacterium]|jgi:rhomboid protease GluP|nr:rane endopeptidase [Symbiobacteriaceae bacterium]
MPIRYVQDVTQRFTEFGGFCTVEPAQLPESVAEWADAVLERVEAGLLTLVAILTAGPEGAMRSVSAQLTTMGEQLAQQERLDVQIVMLIVTGERLTRDEYDRWQALKVQQGRVRLVPWVVDLTRNQVFAHQGPPFGIDPDLEMLAQPEPVCEGEEPAEVQQPAASVQPGRREAVAAPTPWVTSILLIIVAAIWLIMSFQGGALDATESSLLQHEWGAVSRPDMWVTGQFWRLFTAVFLHIGAVHLAMNGFSLWTVGRAVEWLYGPWRMLFIYLTAGVVGSIASSVLGPAMIISAGASGAIFGLLGAILWFRLSSPVGEVIQMKPLLTTLALNLGISLTMYKLIDNWNHVGGLVGGFVAAAVVGVPTIAGVALPRFRPGRLMRGVAGAMLTLALAAFVSGVVVLPGPGRDLARAYEAFNAGQYDAAEAGIERAVQRQEDNPILRHNLLVTYYRQGKCSDAEAQLRELRALAPEYSELGNLEMLVRACGK